MLTPGPVCSVWRSNDEFSTVTALSTAPVATVPVLAIATVVSRACSTRILHWGAATMLRVLTPNLDYDCAR